jgi:hypothetical protein
MWCTFWVCLNLTRKTIEQTYRSTNYDKHRLGRIVCDKDRLRQMVVAAHGGVELIYFLLSKTRVSEEPADFKGLWWTDF